jgi:hypothetical protein
VRSGLEVADIFRAAGSGYRAAQNGHLSLAQLKVMTAIDAAKMPVMGNAVSRAMAAEYIRHLQRRAHSGGLSWAASLLG